MKAQAFLVIFFLPFWAFAQTQATPSEEVFRIERVGTEKQSLKGYVSILSDSNSSLSIEQVASSAYRSRFKKAQEWKGSFPLGPKASIWIKIRLQNHTEELRWRIGNIEKYNNIAYFSPDQRHFYANKSGLHYKPSEKHLPHDVLSNYSVPVFLTREAQDIYIKSSSLAGQDTSATEQQIISFTNGLYIIPEKQLEIYYTANNNFEIMFLAICFCMMFYNVCIYFFVKDKSYLYYSLAIVGVVLYFVSLNGYYFSVFLDTSINRYQRDLFDILSALGADIGIFAFLSFSQVFLFKEQRHLRWYKILQYLKWYVLIANVLFKCALLLINTSAYSISNIFHNTNYGLVVVALMILCVYLWRNKSIIYRYYVYANLPFFVVLIIYILYAHFYVDLAKTILLMENSFAFGIVLQIISFSIALAARINFMRQEIEQKKFDNEQLNHRLLRTQMNPHFIFNSLATIQNYLFENEPQKTALYLAKFSKLMRQILESSREDFVSLHQEIQTLDNYLQLQKMRFGDKLTYHIEVAPGIDPDELLIPPMFAQPFIENSIEHGLLHKAGEGLVQIRFSLDTEQDILLLEVKDNGVGLEQAKTLRSELKKEHKSLATQITQERLTLLRQKYKMALDFMLYELKTHTGEAVGTQVKVELPYRL